MHVHARTCALSLETATVMSVSDVTEQSKNLQTMTSIVYPHQPGHWQGVNR
jgi:hypothetical protein